jgi:integrase
LELSDIRWKSAELLLRNTKGHRDRVVPLLDEVGSAVAEYVSTFSLFDGSMSRLFEVVPESGSGVLLERTGTGTGNRLSGGI